MFGIFKQMTIQPRKKIRMVGEPGLPAHESKLRSLTQVEVHGKLGLKAMELFAKLKAR